MNLLRIDSVGGASGDMSLALLAHLGADLDAIASQIAEADIGSFKIVCETAESAGIAGKRVRVDCVEQHHHRHLQDIFEIIANCGLSERAKKLACDTFTRLAAAEGKVHGISPTEVHFHEVGALDSIVDILGACAALCSLDIDAVEVGPLPVGTGTQKCAHGVMPVPVPATAELLSGHEIISAGEKGEMITPTGAALLMEWKTTLPPSHSCALELAKVGYGIGHKEMARPNAIRGMMLTDNSKTLLSDECLELQTNLDDISPEQVAWLQKRLLDKGALDVFSEPISMKKGRNGILLTVLAKPSNCAQLKETVFRESTSLGIRESFKTRTVLKRKTVTVETGYGAIRVKLGLLGDEVVTHSPEFEDCAKAAEAKNVPFREVYDSAIRGLDRLH